MKIYLESFGCSASQAAAETMAGIIRAMGHESVSAEEAEVYICNTCTVKYTTEQKILYQIRRFGELGKKVIVTGCMPEVQLDLILHANPEAMIIGVNAVPKIRDALLSIEAAEKRREGTESGAGKKKKTEDESGRSEKQLRLFSDRPEGFLNMPRVRYNENIHICQISTGCQFACSYCIVHLARGRLVSFPPEEIVRDIRTAVEEGCREIWITSQDDSQYGLDFRNGSPYEGLRLPGLLNMITEIPGDFRVRVGMMNPFSVMPILDDLIGSFRSPKIYKLLHLPIQSASERVLETMNRRHKMSDTAMIIERFREAFPDMNLFTDIIVGFCGETDEDFEMTMEWVRHFRPDKVNISRYSPRPGTKAFALRNLDSRILAERSKRLTALTSEIKLDSKKKMIGKTVQVFVSKYARQSGVMTRTEDYKPVVVNGTDLKPGETALIRITEATPGYFIGVPADEKQTEQTE